MHACLLIPEILQHIFSDIHDVPSGLPPWDRFSQPGRQESRRSLAALSLVCRSFKDIALDMLWAELKNLEPLFTCLPPDLWARTDDQKLIMQRSATTEDWLVFEKYASRVRVLGHSDVFGRIDAKFIHDIMGFSSQSLLVPNLRVLSCGRCPRGLHSFMGYLLGPHLVNLRLTAWEADFWTTVMSPVVSSLGRHSPQLEVITLPTMPRQINALAGLSRLQTVSLASLSDETLSTLSCLVGLRELDITITEPFDGGKLQSCTSCLDKLVIRSSSTLTFAGQTVEGWVVQCRSLELRFFRPETAVDVRFALCKLVNILLWDGLECILLNGTKMDDAFSLDTFTPLMQFSGLQEVSLTSFCMSLIDDVALGSIIKSWTRLRRLDLGTAHFWQTRPRITFCGLVTLLSSCPELTSLGLVFDATNVGPPTDEKPEGGVCNTNIINFRVGCSPIEQPQQVAVALSAILPCLREINVEIFWGPDRDIRKAKWSEVLERIGN
ncbi:hypothetical protein DEU56DRAFT_906502 [Suillus clintonianus]|uniref:uncharacterized protein n=1 Tax=Suillus clintonianus TaxID=1904413 RepID=UPI001B867EBB|nr:uncharacterized protein DEU56DRAFT_906502 [Suillus clintonianus]KAG2156341.1 hypothetical protein DEU56DRAFT_906502 [Suillus clintonianus]